MKEYYDLFQNQVIPQLLRKLDYFSSEEDLDYQEFQKDMDKKRISNCELFNAMSSEIRRNNMV